MIAARELLQHARGKSFIGDTGYDSNEFRAEIRAKGMKAVIHSKPERKHKPRLSRKLYRIRYRVECFFHDLKRFRAIATRYEKTTTSYLGVIHAACIYLLLSSP